MSEDEGVSIDVGTVINGQYTVIEHIGRGGMADVWSARDQRLQRLVAIKTIVAGLSLDRDPLDLFEQEAQTIAQMEHPHILPIYDFGDHDSTLYIVMRYVTGGSLDDKLVASGAMEPAEVLRVADAVARALDHAHGKNVIHLDLKPPNILLDSSQSPYLADFGLATVLDPQGRARNPGSGTLLYMAPEQLVAETLDHRADIYSFGILIFHMLTGSLPFNGDLSLALKQLQSGAAMPYIEDIVPDVPPEVTYILRRATAQEPEDRPRTHGDIVDALREALQPTDFVVDTAAVPSLTTDTATDATAQLTEDLFTEPMIDSADANLLEAANIFSRARASWQGGNGRFLLGVTHFMLISDYYKDAATHNLQLNDAGRQMLLRGALEYDYHLAHWWGQLDADNQRWVSLHALRSGNAPARIRALRRLETLPDDPNDPVIPALVASALERETHLEALEAALQVLATRAQYADAAVGNKIELTTVPQGRVEQTLTRLGVQVSEMVFWREVVYSEEVDTLIAETAFHENDDIAEQAARTVGTMRSLTAVRVIARAERENRPGALRALATVRDEVPALPDDVTQQGKAYAWISNTVRRLTANPLDGILRFLLVLLGATVAMGEQVYNTFLAQQLFSPERWGSTISVGLVFGVFVALTVIVADELSTRLRGFWQWWLRLGVFGVLGAALGTLTFAGFTWLFLYFIPQWDLVRFGGVALAFGFVVSPLLRLSGWQSVTLTTLVTFAGVYAAHANFYQTSSFSIWAVAPFGLLVGAFCGWQAAHLARPTETKSAAPNAAWIALAAGGGIAWSAGVWLWYTALYDAQATGSFITWDGVLGIFLVMVLLGAALAYALTTLQRAAFVGSALISFGGIMLTMGDALYAGEVPFAPQANSPFFYFQTGQEQLIFSVTLPAIVVVALGAYGRSLWQGWLNWLHEARSPRERSTWFNATLLYTLVVTVMVSVLALFSLKTSVVWALGWSAWAFVTCIAALATWRMTRWGAQLLLISGMLLLAGGFIYDMGSTILMTTVYGRDPALLQDVTISIGSTTLGLSTVQFWGLWSLLVGGAAWGAQRRRLWGAIGLVALLIGWFGVAIFTPVAGSVAVLAVTSVALVSYGVASEYDHLEANRFAWRDVAIGRVPAASVADSSSTAAEDDLQTRDVTTSADPDPDDDPDDNLPTEALPDAPDATGQEAATEPMPANIADLQTITGDEVDNATQEHIALETDTLPDTRTITDASAQAQSLLNAATDTLPDTRTVVDAKDTAQTMLDESDKAPLKSFTQESPTEPNRQRVGDTDSIQPDIIADVNAVTPLAADDLPTETDLEFRAVADDDDADEDDNDT